MSHQFLHESRPFSTHITMSMKPSPYLLHSLLFFRITYVLQLVVRSLLRPSTQLLSFPSITQHFYPINFSIHQRYDCTQSRFPSNQSHRRHLPSAKSKGQSTLFIFSHQLPEYKMYPSKSSILYHRLSSSNPNSRKQSFN